MAIEPITLVALGRLTSPDHTLAHWAIYNSGQGYIYGMKEFPQRSQVNQMVAKTWIRST